MTRFNPFIYLSQTNTEDRARLCQEYGCGEMIARSQFPPTRRPWAFDNGAYGDYYRGRSFEEEDYRSYLPLVKGHEWTPDFIVVPDEYKGGMKSLRYSIGWLDELRSWNFGAPLYLVIQDGMTLRPVAEALHLFDGMFLGGSMKWKKKSAGDFTQLAHSRGMKVHVGSIAQPSQIRWSRKLGFDSVDSATPIIETGALLPYIMEALKPVHSPQQQLFDPRELSAWHPPTFLKS